MEGVTLFCGDYKCPLKVGNGKTLFLVAQLREDFNKGLTVVSNLNLDFKHTKIKSFSEILDMENVVVGVDEITSVLGNAYSGISSDFKDDYITFTAQQRKREIPVYLTNQFIYTTPKFIRRSISKIYNCYKVHKYPIPDIRNLHNYVCLTKESACKKEHIFFKQSLDGFFNFRETYGILKQKNVRELYGLYDTKQIIKRIDLSVIKNKANEKDKKEIIRLEQYVLKLENSLKKRAKKTHRSILS